MTGPAELFRFQALLLPWAVTGLKTFASTGSTWHDGDTFNALVDHGTRHYGLFHVRAAGYNAAELTGVSKPRGLADLAFAQTLVESGQIVYINSLAFVASSEEDNFGRMLGYVTLPDAVTQLGPTMINAGHGVPMNPEVQIKQFLRLTV